MTTDERLPGITFYLEDAEVSNPAPGKTIAKSTLTAHVHDWNLWEKVQGKLNGMRLYANEDFKSELIAMLEDDVASTEAKLDQQRTITKETTASLLKENEALKARVAELEGLERQFQELLGA